MFAAVQVAFALTDVPREEFTPTEWAKDPYGKTHPVEWEILSGPNSNAYVNIDKAHVFNGPESRVYTRMKKMKKYYRDSVVEAASELGVTVEELDSESGKDVVIRVAEKYTDGNTHWLWEHMSVPRFSVQDSKAWSWIGQFLDKIKGSVILFFNAGENTTVFKFVNPSDVVNVLGETYNFEFYISDYEASFLLCFNHHDYLVAAGSAKPWLEERVRNQAT